MVHVKVNMCPPRAYKNVKKSDVCHAIQYILRSEKLTKKGMLGKKLDLRGSELFR